MTVKNRIQRLFRAIALLLLLSSAPLFGQNLITNGNFESSALYGPITPPSYTDFIQVDGPYGVEAGHYVIDNTTNDHGGGGGWPMPSDSHGKFMMVNGYDRSDNPTTKVVWRQTVSVTPYTVYTFSCRVANLNRTYLGQIFPAELQLKINGNNEGGVNTLPQNNNWQNWTYSWTSGNVSQAMIEIYDTHVGFENLGNDFCIDDIVFKLDDGYSLTATGFTKLYCGDITPIDLNGHYIISWPPNGNGAPPLQVSIRRDTDPWGTGCDTYYHMAYATVGSDNKIYLTLHNQNYHGTDYLWFQVSRFGLTAQGLITIQFFGPPSNCTPQGLPPDEKLCLGGIASFNPSATWSANGSEITDSGWQFRKIGMPDWENSNEFQNWVTQWGGVGEYSLMFFAENGCDRVYSEPYNFTICDVPQVTLPTVSTICTGSAEPEGVSVNWNFNTGNKTWQYKRDNGDWTDFVWGEFDLQPGDQLRYRVTWDYCGGSPLISDVINVVSGPQFNSAIPVSFESGYCPGSAVSLPSIQSSWYDDYGMSVTPGWYYVNYDPTGSPSYEPINGSSITLGNESVSVTPCLENSECGFSPFVPAFDLVVYEAPSIQGLDELPDSLGPVCSGTSLGDILPVLTPEGHFTDYGWEISAGQNPSGYQSNLPQTLSASDHGKWLRYHVESDCNLHDPAYSEPIRLWVGDLPTLNNDQIDPLGTVCDGTMVASLVDVHVTDWNLFDDPDESFERWEVLLNGLWTEFTEFELIHDGCQVRYHAHNECGDAIVSAGTVTVTEGPSFYNPGAPLAFNAYYCDGEVLEMPNHPIYDDHDINVNDEYWVYSDETGYHPIPLPLQLDESWNGVPITYVLLSDCGGEIYYPTPFTLTVKGRPEVEVSMNGSSTFCVDAPIDLDAEIEWHLCTQNTQASSWQYAPANQPDNYSNFDPVFGIPEAGTFLVNYHAVAVECEFDAYGNPLTVTVEAAPEFEDPEHPFELERFCEGVPLQIPDDPIVNGHVDDDGWLISNPDGEFSEIDPGYILSNEDDGRLLKYFAVGCNVYIQHEVEIHVDGKPLEEYSIANRICKGQALSYELVYTNGYPVTQWEWKIGSTSADPINPDEYTFDYEGDYLIYYRVGNDCGWSEYMEPLHLSVTAGPEFDNSSLPTESQYVCEGTTLEELLLQSGITAPSLVDPSVPHNPLGWFINGQQIELTTVIVEGFHGSEICYGVEGDCSDVPVYSRGFELHVYGYPEVTQIPSIGGFCDGDAVQLPDPEIDFHHGDGHVIGSWQIQSSDGSWGNLPTTWSADHNGLEIRYHLENTVCPDLFFDSQPLTIIIHAAPSIDEDEFPANGVLLLCAGGALEIDAHVDWHQSEPGEEGWQVCANGQDWDVALEGHVFDPNHVDHFFDGKYLRYHAESTQCPDLEDNSIVMTIQLTDTPVIDDSGWPEQARFCSDGALGIDEPVGLPGEWQVSVDGQDWFTELEGHVFDPNRVDDYFDGKFLHYYVHSSCGDDVSKTLTLKLMGTVNNPIVGETQVAMMNSFWAGVYDYHIDSSDLVQPVEWSLEGANWQLRPKGRARCLVYVSSLGTAVLHARVTSELCANEVDVALPINATYFGVEDNDAMKVKVYPNPTRNTVTVEAEGIERLRLIDMMGQVLEVRDCGRSDNVVLHLSGYTPAVYMLEIKTVNGTVKKRLVVSR